MFAPKLKVKGTDGREVSIQQFLQGAFLNMWELVVRTVADLEAVIGFEVSLYSFIYAPSHWLTCCPDDERAT